MKRKKGQSKLVNSTLENKNTVTICVVNNILYFYIFCSISLKRKEIVYEEYFLPLNWLTKTLHFFFLIIRKEKKTYVNEYYAHSKTTLIPCQLWAYLLLLYSHPLSLSLDNKVR